MSYIGSSLPVTTTAPPVAPVPVAPVPVAPPPVAAAPPLPQSPMPAYAYGAAATPAYSAAVSTPSYGAAPQSVGAQSVGAQSFGGGQLVGLIYFGHGSTALNSSDREVIRQVATMQQQTGGRPLRIVGHASARTSVTDPVKHRMTNLNVSMSRANRVAAELVRLGVREDSVMVVGKADSEPVYHEFMPTGEAGNRRVEIFIE